MKNRVWVGTLHCGEGDFEESKRWIAAQEGVRVTHHVISGMPESAAHAALWDAWDAAKAEHNVFVKVDADTVLTHTRVLSAIAQMFENVDGLTGIQCYLNDYFTDSLIYGLNCYSPRVVFKAAQDDLFCDRVDTGHDRVLRGASLPTDLIPAGLHCHRSNLLQAFHFGVHRGLKNQQQNEQRVKEAWQKHGDNVRFMALQGFAWAQSFHSSRKFNYADEELKAAYNQALLELPGAVG